MRKPKKFTLDFTGITHWFDFHEVIRKAFHFPEWYGRNWDAFWDLLEFTTGFVEIRGLGNLPDELKPSGEMVLELLEKNKDEMREAAMRTPQLDRYFDYVVID